MITDAEIEKALDYLRDTATKAAQARATRIYVEEYRKTVKAMLMQQHASEPLGAQEREAYASETYRAHLKAIEAAVEDDEKYRFLREAAHAKIEAYRTFSANVRGGKI